MVSLVVGKLDEISRAIGSLEASTTDLRVSFDKHCLDDDRRHGENISALHTLSDRLGKLTETIQASRFKLVGAAFVVTMLIGFVGWLIQPFITTLVSRMWH